MQEMRFMGTYTYPKFPYTGPADLQVNAPQRRPLVIVGAGPVGLAAAIDARLKGIAVLVFDEDDTVSIGSRAVCYAKRALEVLDRLGVGDPICDKGVSWNVGRTFFREKEVYRFDLVPDAGHKRPGMINLQQYYLEETMVARAMELGADIRWRYKVVGVQNEADHVRLRVDTPDGTFDIEADWLIVADGARSPIRNMLGLEIEGRIFMDRFLIADVIMKADYPAERWFWFDPPFHRNQSVLLHKQSDNVWRIDFQLGWDADPEEEKKPENVIPRLKAMLGDERPFDLEWVSIYTFQCRRMKDFRAGRALFVGDAAHQVSPFGARGANSGFQDTDDLLWKLQLVMDGQAPEALLDTYSADRTFAADENLMNSTRSTDFITPKSRVSKTFRNAVLDLAQDHAFARRLVNSGRLSVPAFLTQSALNTPDIDSFAGDMVPGAPMDDAPIQVAGQDGWLLDQLGNRFQLLVFAGSTGEVDAATLAQFKALENDAISVQPVLVTPAGGQLDGFTVLADPQGLIARRYDAKSGTAYLARPDQHVAARWRAFDPTRVRAAVARATCNA
jgi:3-(3-hydroxy-phenyl)propionate hydroxylase